ncbi:acyltransferase family-domain-containing protein [Rhexocercosporidium sp. MPI-PUGE-AT-0058]|nr:acyltransferase family-domain-containing protein [Rhexocercosporidium sp. MPI-PUGE-AT-0058]
MDLDHDRASFFNARPSIDLDQYSRDGSFDLEAMMRDEEGLISASHINKRSRSVFGYLEESRILQTLLCYPAPDSLKIRPTSWLDGVRGIAAFEVYMFHTISSWHTIFPAWHAEPDQTNILQLPALRTFFDSGGTSVCVFFVLSGYVLTYKSLRWIRAGSRQLVYPSVASSMFRRGFRLYLPPILLTFFEMIATRFGYAPPLNFTFVAESTALAQFLDWIKETNYLVNPFYNFNTAIQGFVIHPKYDPVIWTIPLEFYGSFICYFLVLLLARVPSNATRMCLVATFAALCMFLGAWNGFCFSTGMLLADFNLAQEENSIIPLFQPSRYGVVWKFLFMAAFYVAGFPTLSYPEAHVLPMFGYEFLRSSIPMSLNMEDHSRFWWSISGVTLLLCISQLPSFKSFFEANICQYLGKIAFSLYLVHQFCVMLFGFMMQRFILGLFGLVQNQGGFFYWVACVIWYIPFTGLVFGIAAQVERLVDAPSVRFAKWLEEKCLSVYKNLS